MCVSTRVVAGQNYIRKDVKEQGDRTRADVKEQGDRTRADVKEQGDRTRADVKEQGDSFRGDIESLVRFIYELLFLARTNQSNILSSPLLGNTAD